MHGANNIFRLCVQDKKLVATAVLSTTARAKAREARKEANAKRAAKGPMELESGPALERVTSHLSTTSYLSLDTVPYLVARL